MRKSRAAALDQQAAEAPNKETLQLPHDPINECVVIAAVIVSSEARHRYLSLPSTLFLAPGHADAWLVLQDIFGRGLTYDPATVRQLSGGRVNSDALDGYIAARPELPPNLKHHVETLHWDFARISAAKGPIAALLEAVRDPTANPDTVRSLARGVFGAFDGHGSGRFRRSTDAIITEHRDVLTKRRTGHAHFTYGIQGLDLYGPGDRDERHNLDLNGTPRLIPGAAPGMTTVVTGVSGSGKTTSVAKMVLHWAEKKETTLWGAWEVKDGWNLELLAVLSLGWHRGDALTGAFSEEQQHELEAEMERLGEFVKFLDLPFDRRRNERSTNEKNLDVIQQEIADVDPNHFVADLFQRALVQTKPEEEARAVYRFQAIMQEEKCHGVLVHQSLIKGEQVAASSDHRPSRETLKGSAAYVEAPDTLLAWYRPFFYKSVPDVVLECHILKQRYGKWPQVVELDWDPEYGVIENGRTIEVERPGEKGAVDSFLDDAISGKGKKSKKPARRPRL